MKRSFLFALVLLAVLLSGCLDSCTSRRSRATAPRPPQTPPTDTIRLHDAEQALVADTLKKLNTDRNTLRSKLSQWRKTPAPSGPVFSGEAPAVAQDILDLCDQLEREANELKNKSYVRRFQGAGDKIEEILRFARESRDEVRSR